MSHSPVPLSRPPPPHSYISPRYLPPRNSSLIILQSLFFLLSLSVCMFNHSFPIFLIPSDPSRFSPLDFTIFRYDLFCSFSSALPDLLYSPIFDLLNSDCYTNSPLCLLRYALFVWIYSVWISFPSSSLSLAPLAPLDLLIYLKVTYH